MTVAGLEREVLGHRYELQRVIAEGGMGQVWRGRDVLFDRPVAVKLLRGRYADDPAFAARFRAEATHAASLHHPNIAAVHDYGEDELKDGGEHVTYLVMELVEGQPLTALLSADGPLGTEATLAVLRQTAAALAEAHRAGVVHRDVKPSNILVRPDGLVKLTDFGISRSAASVPLTDVGQVIGTPQYMAPEQARGEHVGAASDVYALGLVGYEALTGRAAFVGDNAVTIALKQVTQAPDPLPADLPGGVRSLIEAALAKDPRQRIPDGEAFLAAVDAAIDHSLSEGGGPTPTIPVAVPSRPAVSLAPAPVAAATASTAPRSGRRRRWSVRAVLLLAALTLPVASAVLLAPDDGRVAGGDRASASSRGAIVLDAADYIGRPADAVEAELTALRLTVERRTVVARGAAPGTVTDVDPAGVPLVAGDEVRLSVTSAATTTGPDVGRAGGGSGAGGAAQDQSRQTNTRARTGTTAGSAAATPPGSATAPPSTAAPSTAPRTTAPQSTAPQTTAPQTTAPQSTAPQSTAPQTTAPQTTAPQTTAPQTTAPQTTAPQTTAPATTSATSATTR